MKAAEGITGARVDRTGPQGTPWFNRYSALGLTMSPHLQTATTLRPGEESAVRTGRMSRSLTGRMALLTPRKRVREFESTRYPDRPMTLRLTTGSVRNAKKRGRSVIVQETKTSLSLTPIAAAVGTDPITPVRRTTSGKGNPNEPSRHHLRIHQRLARNTARKNRNGEKSGAKSAEKASSR